MDEHLIDKANILGFSDGGNIAMAFAIIKEPHTKLIAENIPDSKLVFVKGDHFIANKNPKEFNRIVLDFLKRKTDIWST